MSSSYEIFDEDYTHEKKGKENEELKSLCRILPKVVPDQTLRNMRHERICHTLKGVTTKCDGCNKSFTSKELIWSTVVNWVGKIKSTTSSIFSKFEKKGYLLSKYQMESLALRFSYDMEFYNRHPCVEMERILKTIVLLQYNKHDYRHKKGCFKKSNECRFSYPQKKFSQIMK
jgi:hypothetical protein